VLITEVGELNEERTAVAATKQEKTEAAPGRVFRVRAIMRQGTAASLPEVWERYSNVETARAAVKGLYHDDRVLRAFIVLDEAPPRFVEWVER
jgi:hypothetical protein